MRRDGKNIAFCYVSMVVVLLLISASFIFDWIPIDILRYISLFIILLQIFFEIRTKNKFFLTSPLFILSSLSFIFFSFAQGIAINLYEPSFHPKVISAYGSDGERYLAAFAFVGLASYVLVLLMTRIKLEPQKIKYTPENLSVFRLFMFCIIALTIINVYFFYTAPSITATLNIPLRHLLPPLQAFMLIFLIRRIFISGKKFTLLSAFFFCILFAGMFAVHEGKIPILIGATALFYWLRLTKITLKKISLYLVIALVLSVSGLQLISVIRSPETSIKVFSGAPNAELHKSNFPKISKVPLLKILYRQIDTVYCFNKVLNYGLDEAFILSEQFFWIKGLVPRFMWPEKPSLSQGKVYAKKYCGVDHPDHNHNSSITLLGQPFIKGGNVGLFLNMGLLILGLAGITWLTREPLGLATLSVVVLSPWLIDMDQNFGLYIANLVKFFFIILPLIIVVGLSEKNQHIKYLIHLFSFKRERTDKK